MPMTEYMITVWTKHITDDGVNHYLAIAPITMPYHFRLLDDDGIIYAYGNCNKESFTPLDAYQIDYGCTEIQYQNKETGEWETL